MCSSNPPLDHISSGSSQAILAIARSRGDHPVFEKDYRTIQTADGWVSREAFRKAVGDDLVAISSVQPGEVRLVEANPASLPPGLRSVPLYLGQRALVVPLGLTPRERFLLDQLLTAGAPAVSGNPFHTVCLDCAAAHSSVPWEIDGAS